MRWVHMASASVRSAAAARAQPARADADRRHVTADFAGVGVQSEQK